MLGLLVILGAQSALAAGQWKLESSHRTEAADKAGIQALLDQHPDTFGTSDAEKVAFLAVEEQHYRWDGPTICQPRDPRLAHATTDGEIRMKPEFDGGMSSGMTSSGMIAGDPCLEDLPPDGRWVLDGERRTEYRSESELAQFLEKNRRSFPGIAASELEFASEIPQHYHWEGKSVCPPNDPRLSLEEDAGEVKFKHEAALSSPFRHESTRDPCGS
jgi:hypothetical protein